MDLLRYLRETGMSQAELARRLGVTRSAVNQWLSGATAPSTQQITRIARVTEGAVGPADLIPGGESSGAAGSSERDDESPASE